MYKRNFLIIICILGIIFGTLSFIDCDIVNRNNQETSTSENFVQANMKIVDDKGLTKQEIADAYREI